MKILVFFNSKSGTAQTSPELVDNAIERIRSKISDKDSLNVYDVQEVDEEEIVGQQRLNEEDRIFIAGGDGTLSSVINKIIDFKIPVGILPLGTFNNFSKCLSLSQNVEEAIDQLFSGRIINVDVAKVNGRVILNNSSVGAYPKLVSFREESQVNFNLSKPTATFISFIKAVFLFPLIKVSLISEGKQVNSKTSFVMVSNNKYELSLDKIGERASLTEGLLYVYLIKCKMRLCVIKVLFKALFNKLSQEKDFELISTKRAKIKIHKKEVRVSSDGEVFKTSPPLDYEICPGCLKIIVPNDYE